jgi:hypothetical protein
MPFRVHFSRTAILQLSIVFTLILNGLWTCYAAPAPLLLAPLTSAATAGLGAITTALTSANFIRG